MDNLDYGIIGNCRSAALISKTGSIDWCCLPEFDSSSVFAKLLDQNIGGSFEILTDESYAITQEYLYNTSILVTRFSDGPNTFEVHDFMPRYFKQTGEFHTPPEIIRLFRHRSGTPEFRIKYDPKLEYALGETVSYVKENFIISLTNTAKFDSLFLYSNMGLDKIAESQFITLTSDGYIVMGYNEKIFRPTMQKIILEYELTKVYWLQWM